MTLHSGWKFAKGQQEAAYDISTVDSNWQTVTVPHDWAIAGPFIPGGDASTAKLPWKGEGWYRHHTQVPATFEGKHIYLVFDGVMAFPSVYVNGITAGLWDYGYNSFYIDVTDFIKPGVENVIAVHADTRQHDSRWYPGAGIFRKVQLIAVNPVHTSIWGTYVTTPMVKANYSKVRVSSELINAYGDGKEREVTLRHTIKSPKGNIVQSADQKVNLTWLAYKKVESSFTLNSPQRWEVDHGVMYTMETSIIENGEIVDSYDTPFGIRSIRFTPDDGFYLNDRRVQLKGVNLHHDHGPLGAAFYPDAMYRQLKLLKEMGCNAVRTSHNVAAPELLDMCDTMGILVFNEIFDKYDRKAGITETTHFENFASRNMRNFVRRDRNHPSIFLWSVGNEIGDVQWDKNGGFAKLQFMVSELKRHDSTRPVTLVCDSRNSAQLRHFDFYDVHAWNYGRRYDLARQLEPNKAVVISESASTVSTRGFYEWPLPEKKTDFTKSLQVSSYDLNAPEWAEISDDDFMWQEEENYIAGEFVWTGFDYLGEPTPYDSWSMKKIGLPDSLTSMSSYFGIFDLVGIPKDRYYLYKSYWKPEDTTIHILPHWNWPGKEGDTIPVFVYTNGDCAELFLNGKSLGMECKKPDSPNSVERFRLMWPKVVYTAGELEVKAYKEGMLLGEQSVRTTGEPYQLRLTPEEKNISPGGMGLSYILVEAIDKNGEVCPTASNSITLNINGNAQIVGVGNGNPQSTKPFQSNSIDLFYGKAMVIVRSTEKGGQVTITATGDGLKKAEATIMVK